jgi:CxxC-x17-CxxC domain-containing protein
MTFEDKILRCHDCGKEFTFTAFEQEQFQSMGYTNSPRRCISCRQDRKARQTSRLGSNTRNYNNHDEKTRRQMFSATCIECKKETQVPFKPSQDKPVYCGICYNKIRDTR